MEIDDGLVLMDPHAAHERVLYEEFLKKSAQNIPCSQQLLTPETIEFPAKEALALKKNLQVLHKMGFGINEFGDNTFIVDAAPDFLSVSAVRRAITDILSDLTTFGERGASRFTEENIARAACKAAVKAHGRISEMEMEDLVIQLLGTDMPYTCPHGRPTLIHISFRELKRKFGRV